MVECYPLRMAAKKDVLHIRGSDVLTLSPRSRKIFLKALIAPPKPNRKAVAAIKRFRREIPTSFTLPDPP